MDSYLKGPDSFLARFASLCVHVSRVMRVSLTSGAACQSHSLPRSLLQWLQQKGKRRAFIWGFLLERLLRETLRIKLTVVAGACFTCHQAFLAL